MEKTFLAFCNLVAPGMRLNPIKTHCYLCYCSCPAPFLLVHPKVIIYWLYVWPCLNFSSNPSLERFAHQNWVLSHLSSMMLNLFSFCSFVSGTWFRLQMRDGFHQQRNLFYSCTAAAFASFAQIRTFFCCGAHGFKCLLFFLKCKKRQR